MKKKSKLNDDLTNQIIEEEDGDLIDEIVDDYSYFYDEKPQKKDKWYSVILNTRNVLIALVFFCVGATCLGFYSNSVYFKNKEKTYLTPALRKEIFYWDTSDRALDFLLKTQNDIHDIVYGLQGDSKTNYTISQADVEKTKIIFNEAKGIYNDLKKISYLPPNTKTYKDDVLNTSESYLNSLLNFYGLESNEFNANGTYLFKGNITFSWLGPIYQGITSSPITQLEYDAMTSKIKSYGDQYTELSNRKHSVQTNTEYRYAESEAKINEVK